MKSILYPVIAGLGIGIMIIVLFSTMMQRSSPVALPDPKNCNQLVGFNSTHAIVSIRNVGQPIQNPQELSSLAPRYLAKYPLLMDGLIKADLCRTISLEDERRGTAITPLPLSYVFSIPKEEAMKLVRDPELHFEHLPIEAEGEYYHTSFSVGNKAFYQVNISWL